MTDVRIATEVTTGALVITVTRGARAVLRLRHGVASALRQRPAAVVMDLSQLPARYVVPALAVGMTRPRRGVPLLACVPPRMRALARLPGVTASPLPLALAALPGFRLAHDRVSARFRPEVTAPSVARALVGEAVKSWRVRHLALPAQLIVSELVSNAVEHAAATEVEFEVLRLPHGVCIAVRDNDPRPPVTREPAGDDPARERGRGLSLVARTAYRWGCITGTADKIVWAALRDSAPLLAAA
jgi:anti-sigma regulatory factor (Ser/Thr protein kinase)